MLIEFGVSNFLSLKDKQIFSLLATKDKTLNGNTISSGIKAVPSLLRGAVIYGPNAGGKSNLIKALQFMRAIVIESAGMKPEQTFNIQPFRLDTVSNISPIE